MFIAHVQFSVEPENRQKALDQLLGEVAAVRAMPGCRLFLPFADATDPAGVGVIHEWETAQDFAGYTGSDGFAAVGRVLRPMMTAPPSSRRFAADMLERVA